LLEVAARQSQQILVDELPINVETSHYGGDNVEKATS
jgi:hypothetical protein